MAGPPTKAPSRRALLLGAGGLLAAGAAAVAVDRSRTEPGPAALTIATGPQGAVYREVGRDLAAAIAAASPRTRVSTVATSATVDNLGLLAAGTTDLGLASLDAAAVDANVRAGRIPAAGRLYDSFLHLVVAAESPITDLAGCAGRRVGVGAAGSGTEFTAQRLLGLAAVTPSARVRLGQAEAMAAVASGALDAAFSLTGFPTPAIAALAGRRPVRLVPLGDHLDVLDRSLPRVYGAGTLPAGTYSGVPAADTVYVPNLLLVRPGLPDATVALVAGAVFSPDALRFWTHPDSRRIDVRAAVATGSVALHPAASARLRALKP